MKVIKVAVDDAAYALLVARRKKARLTSVAAYLLKRAGVQSRDQEAADVVRQAKVDASKMGAGVPFGLRDLIGSAAWKRHSKGARLRAGKLFFAAVATGKAKGVRAAGKNASGHQLYMR